MLFNVWVLIWPNQKKILGIVPATDEEKARARKVAAWPRAPTSCCRSRMLLCMARRDLPRAAAVLKRRRTPELAPADLPEQVARALREDVGSGDVTARWSRAATRAGARAVP